MVQIGLGGQTQRYMPIRTAVCTREKPPFFLDLQSMLMVEENHASGSRTTESENQMLYMEAERPHGCGGRGGSAHNSGGRQEQERMHRGSADNNFGPSTSRGIQAKAASEIGNQRSTWNAGIVARRATRRASAKKSAPIQRYPDPDLGRPNKEIGRRTGNRKRAIEFDDEDHLRIKRGVIR